MKRILSLALCLVLLAGCAAGPAAETKPSVALPTETAPVPEDPGLYIENSRVERDTQGALWEYQTQAGPIRELAAMNDGLLLLTGDDSTALTFVTGENLVPQASAELNCAVSLSGGTLLTGDTGVGFYDSGRNAMVFLDTSLEETSAFTLPEGIQGTPLLSPDWKQVFYLTDAGIQVLELQTGISRLLKEVSGPNPVLTGFHCDGALLELWTADDEGRQQTDYVSTSDGTIRFTSPGSPDLVTYGDWYFVEYMEGNVYYHLFAKAGEDAREFTPLGEYGVAYPLSPEKCLFIGATDAGGVLDAYDLETGKRTASLGYGDPELLWSPVLSSGGKYVYFIGDTGESGTFYRWEMEKNPVSDETVYTATHYTAQSPDTVGLAACKTKAKAIGETYGVDLRVWEDALVDPPEDYTCTGEYRTAVYDRDLSVLEYALSRYPDGFFALAAGGTDSGVLHINLVREIAGNTADGTLDTAVGIQYWRNGDVYITLALGDELEPTFYHEMSHIIDTRVFGNSLLYDDWEDLNPAGFAYDYDYIANLEREPGPWLEDGDRAFIDTYSMSFPREDRARILEYAMTPDNEAYFTSDTMQSKLRQIGLAIREAFDLEDFADPLPWEQYLREPITSEKGD